jgi:hypothetical protein
MRVQHFCYYLTDWPAERRQQDYDSNKVVKCLKDETFKGYANLTVGGSNIRVDNSNKAEFRRRLWEAVGKSMGAALKEQTAIVPVPNSLAIIGSPPNYRTLGYAQAIAAASGGKVVAVDALRWKKVEPAAHKQPGFRTPEPRYENMTVIECPKLPVILFDDVITSGSTFIASFWRLDEAGNAPKEGFVAARSTKIQEPKMFVSEVRELEIPHRPFF